MSAWMIWRLRSSQRMCSMLKREAVQPAPSTITTRPSRRPTPCGRGPASDRPAAERERGEQRQRERRDHQVAVDHGEAADREREERRDPEQRTGSSAGSAAPAGGRARTPATMPRDAGRQHRRLGQVVHEVRRAAPGSWLDRHPPPERERRAGRVVRRVQRVAGDEPVRAGPDQRARRGPRRPRLTARQPLLRPHQVKRVGAAQQPRLGPQQPRRRPAGRRRRSPRRGRSASSAAAQTISARNGTSM